MNKVVDFMPYCANMHEYTQRRETMYKGYATQELRRLAMVLAGTPLVKDVVKELKRRG